MYKLHKYTTLYTVYIYIQIWIHILQKEINYIFIWVVSKDGQYLLKQAIKLEKKTTVLRIYQFDYI